MQVLPKDPRHTRAEPRARRVLLRDHCHEWAEPSSHTVLIGDPHTHGQTHCHAEAFHRAPQQNQGARGARHTRAEPWWRRVCIWILSDMAGERTCIVAHYPTLPYLAALLEGPAHALAAPQKLPKPVLLWVDRSCNITRALVPSALAVAVPRCTAIKVCLHHFSVVSRHSFSMGLRLRG